MTHHVSPGSPAMSRLLSARTGDAAAIGLSGLCMVHCLILPLAAGFLPLLGAASHVGWVHWLFALIAAPLSLWTFTRPHPQGLMRPAAGIALAGVALLFAGAAEFPSHDWETPVTVAGGVLLTLAHLINISARRRQCHIDG